VLWWFVVCSSTMQSSLNLGGAHCSKRWTLWSTTCPTSALLPFCHLFTDSSWEDQLLAPPLLSSVFSATLLPQLCASFQFVVYCSIFFCVWGQSDKGTILVYLRGGWGECWVMLGTHLFGLLTISQADLELVAGKVSDSWSSHCLPLHPSHHLGSQ
jgi:hypothetical protein